MARGIDAEQQHPMAEQVKEYQARSRHAWAAASFFSSTSTSTSTAGSSWVEVFLVIWELALYALLVFACIAFYFRSIGIALSFTCISALLYLCMRLTKEERKHKKSKQRMLLPLSM
ncbi:hypothetical protein CFC21_102961 [Triticum aestivum]|uniref:Uncharacterized protein n=3 Tax=Triticum TaxID=4564 RepID=A0A9R0ZZ92_TRITD|nr:uncharacterized protein LOC123156365 [Triticum aestivum]KAF7101713.1 hypothetical protein CFC21_102961 [Triticum aestivum]VAI85491.1 unnamed protein product [Triticum turgidum subsp. durum]